MPYRFVHTADLHLDSPLRSLALRDPDLAELIGNATRAALVRIVDLCLDEKVDALLIAGDLYDGEQTSMKTARFLAAQIRRLHEAGTKVFIVRGNHDAISKITAELTLPDSVKIFRGHAEAIGLDSAAGGLSIAVHGVSFGQPHAPDSLLPKYRAPVEGAVNIGLMHTSLDGAAGHDPYAPCSIADLGAAGFSYWGLGHIHKRSVPRAGAAIVMPGMPQGRDIGESGEKSVTLVTIGDDRSITVEERLTAIAQFERVAVDLDGATEWRAVVGAIGSALRKAREATRSEHLVARLVLTGTTPLAWRLRRDADLLRAEAEDRASVTGKTWLDRLEIFCDAPSVAPGASAGDPLAELRHLIHGEIIGSAGYAAAVAEMADELRGQLPPECRCLFGDDQAAFESALARFVAEGSEDVLARLRARPEAGDEA